MKNTFTKHFKLKKQAYDFFDIPIENDITAFICPFLIENNKDYDIAKRVGSQVNSFLTILNRRYIKSNDRQNGIKFLSHLHKPNQYHLGYSSKNNGKAVSEPRSIQIFDSLRSNRFAKQGLNITNEANKVLLLVKGIGQDIMSDIISNVCRDIFTEYTEEICKINNIPTQEFLIEYFDVKNENWNVKKVQLPVFDNKYIILVPKKIISGSREYSNHYNWFIAPDLSAFLKLKI